MKSLIFIFLLLSVAPSVVTENIHVHAIGWNGEYWLIGGRILWEGPGSSSFLVTWDEETFTLVTPHEIEDMWIEDIWWDGQTWVIVEDSDTADNGRTYAYDVETRTLTLQESISEIGQDVYKVCNLEYCLMWDEHHNLLKCDETRCEDITLEARIPFPFEDMLKMVWNGQYWLISSGGTQGGRILKYDGTSFTDLDVPNHGTSGSMTWNGRYWLIGTLYTPFSSGGLLMYDGAKITDVTCELRKVLEKPETADAARRTEEEINDHTVRSVEDMLVCSSIIGGISLVLYFFLRRRSRLNN